MQDRTALLRTSRRLLTAVALTVAAATVSATAQGVVVLVNGDPITAFDIEQRQKLIQVSLQRTAPRQEVIEELIDEALKIQLLKRFSIEGIDQDVDNAIGNMARRVRATGPQFLEQLAKGGVMANTLKSRVKAEIVWSQIIRGRYQASFQFSDKDIMAKLETRGAEAKVGYDYTLRPILFVVPRGSPDAVVMTRAKEAEAFRARFQDCEQGVHLARTLRDVAVRAPVTRSTADLSPQLRDILEKTEIGKLSSPDVTQQGVEVYALCAKKPSTSENAPGRREIREEMASQQFKVHSQRYLKELRGQAMIEYR